MNDGVRSFKKATDQLSNRFDAKQSVAGDVEHLLKQAIPIDAYMRNNKLTDRVQADWSTLRADLEGLASAYNIAPNWGNNPSSQTGDGANDRLTGTFSYVQGKDNLELPSGTELTIRASAPR